MGLHQNEIIYYEGLLKESNEAISELEKRISKWQSAYWNMRNLFMMSSYSIKELDQDTYQLCIFNETKNFCEIESAIYWAEKRFDELYPRVI